MGKETKYGFVKYENIKCLGCGELCDDMKALAEHIRLKHGLSSGSKDTRVEFGRMFVYSVLKDPRKFFYDTMTDPKPWNEIPFFTDKYAKYINHSKLGEFRRREGLIKFTLDSRKKKNFVRMINRKNKKKLLKKKLSKRFKKIIAEGGFKKKSAEERLISDIRRTKSMFDRKGTPELFYPWMMDYLAKKSSAHLAVIKEELMKKEESVVNDAGSQV